MYVPPRIPAACQITPPKNFISHPFHISPFCDIIERMKRTIWFWVYFVIAIILAVYFATRMIMTGLGYGPVAIVRNISISADTADKDLTALATAAAVAPGTRALSADLNLINTRINSVPGVKDSAVRRKPDGNLSVKVKLYQAVALWTDGENYFPLSADGTIVNRPTDTRSEATVLFRGPVPDDISEITSVAHNMIGDVDYLEWIEGRRWNLITTGGITVMLPEKNPADAIGSLIVLNKNHRILSKNIKVIDMRDNARILVK